jgi:hypothetical protein
MPKIIKKVTKYNPMDKNTELLSTKSGIKKDQL